MTISENAEQFAGKPVKDFDPKKGIEDPNVNYRIRVEYEAAVAWPQLFERFSEDARAGEVTGVVIGAWDPEVSVGVESTVAVDALVEAADKLSNVKAIFLGDITYEESEISWIQQSDISSLWTAYPQLEEFTVRGGNGLSLGELKLDDLRKLTVEAGGLDSSVVRQICQAELPKLEHLEIWLGDDGYGATVTPQDLAPILSGELFPNLTHLGLRDSCIADEVAAAVADSPVLEKIDVLDLSFGTLTDKGAQALLEFPLVSRLKKLDIHHHFVSEEIVQKLKALGMPVDAEDSQEADVDGDDVYRYVAVSE